MIISAVTKLAKFLEKIDHARAIKYRTHSVCAAAAALAPCWTAGDLRGGRDAAGATRLRDAALNVSAVRYATAARMAKRLNRIPATI